MIVNSVTADRLRAREPARHLSSRAIEQALVTSYSHKQSRRSAHRIAAAIIGRTAIGRVLQSSKDAYCENCKFNGRLGRLPCRESKDNRHPQKNKNNFFEIFLTKNPVGVFQVFKNEKNRIKIVAHDKNHKSPIRYTTPPFPRVSTTKAFLSNFIAHTSGFSIQILKFEIKFRTARKKV